MKTRKSTKCDLDWGGSFGCCPFLVTKLIIIII